jgi:hypothetical protein
LSIVEISSTTPNQVEKRGQSSKRSQDAVSRLYEKPQNFLPYSLARRILAVSRTGDRSAVDTGAPGILAVFRTRLLETFSRTRIKRFLAQGMEFVDEPCRLA